MKIAIIAFNNIKFSPYVKTYSNILDDKKVEYEIIYPDRKDMNEDLGVKAYPIKWDKSKHKAINFLKFRREAIKLLKKNSYDFVMVLTTFPAVLLSTFLSRKYKGKYLVDIRDYTHENNKLYFALEKKALANSRLNVISSPGFTHFLPEGEYTLCHNMPKDYMVSPKTEFEQCSDCIIIGYVGSISYASHCKRLADLVKSDNRFKFHFYGNENKHQPVTTYVNELNNERIKCFGPYNPSEKSSIIESTDILFNAYGNDTQLVKCAISNKLYDSFYFKKPLLTSSDTIMSEIAADYSFDFDKCTDNLDAIYDWYHSIDAEAMVAYMNEKIAQYGDEMRAFNQKIDNLIKELL